jgi:hypothetical protein
VKVWKSRYFVLANNTLWYFKSREAAAVGAEEYKIDLQRASVRKQSDKGTHYVEFLYTTPGSAVSTLLLKAPTMGDAQKWVDKAQESKAAAATAPQAAAAAPLPSIDISARTVPRPPSSMSHASSRRSEPPPAPSPALTERSLATHVTSSSSYSDLSPLDKLKATIASAFPPSYPERSGLGVQLVANEAAPVRIGELKPTGSLARAAAVAQLKGSAAYAETNDELLDVNGTSITVGSARAVCRGAAHVCGRT